MTTPTFLKPSATPEFRLSISPTSPRRVISPGLPTAGFQVPESTKVRRPLGRHGSLPDPAFTPSTPFFSTEYTEPSLLPSRIEPGTYIAFALSKDAIVDQHPKTVLAVGQFPVRRYVGLVTSSTFYKNEADQLFQELVVHYVSPTRVEVAVNAGHAVPIFPTAAVGPAHEQPLRTGTLFPWTNYHQWTVFGTRLQVENIYKSSLTFALTEEHFDRVEEIMWPTQGSHQVSLDYANRDVTPLRIPDDALPADIWMDVREADAQADALNFPAEVDVLEK